MADVFGKKPKNYEPQNSAKDDYLADKNITDFKSKIKNGVSDVSETKNIRIVKADHTLFKVISKKTDKPIYEIVHEALYNYFESSLTEKEQKEIIKKMKDMQRLDLD